MFHYSTGDRETFEKRRRYLREAEVARSGREAISKSWRGRSAALLHGLAERLEPQVPSPSQKARTL